MAELIIGHTTDHSALLWIRGDERFRVARVTLKPQPIGDAIVHELLRLRPDNDYTGVAKFEPLEPNKHYRVLVEFSRTTTTLDRTRTAQAGQLRTFPEVSSAGSRFSFLLGSCNLPTARLESLGALLASALGTLVMSRSVRRDPSTWVWPVTRKNGGASSGRWLDWKRLIWPILKTFPGTLKWGAGKGSWLLWAAVAQVTRFQQPDVGLRSPFQSLLDLLADGSPERIAFMIHAGDQLYFDIDAPSRPPVLEEYRRAYRQAWFEDRETRTFLASCPQYMMLDDHEIIDGFANQPTFAAQIAAGKTAYQEYVHSRQPRGDGCELYYSFDYDQAGFFVLDTRTERNTDIEEMISPRQRECFENWLCENRDRLKFVVSSVPFVAQLQSSLSNEDHAKEERDDKWSGASFKAQRDALVDLIYALDVRRLVFLVGDMHCTYHATMRVGPPANRIAIHEVAAGPINQVEFARRGRFYDHYRSVTPAGNPFSVVMRSFHGATAAAVRLTVEPGVAPVVRWRVIPTSRPDERQPQPLGGFIRFPEIVR